MRGSRLVMPSVCEGAGLCGPLVHWEDRVDNEPWIVTMALAEDPVTAFLLSVTS